MSLLFMEVDKNPGSFQAMIWQAVCAGGGHRIRRKLKVGDYSSVERNIRFFPTHVTTKLQWRSRQSKNLKFADNEPMTRCALDRSCHWFRDSGNPPPFHLLPQPIPEEQLLFRNHQQLVDLWDDVLAMSLGWPLDDKALPKNVAEHDCHW
jgi:hypothetical protein